MSLQLLFVGLALACVVGAAVLLLLVLVRRGRGVRDLALAALLIVLAIGVWYTAIRTPLAVP
ncbi:MAG TPA: hypothetical protein VFW12_08110 [Candidatus Limnocylindria bacterium]|nr:hypothetical protein [Candidatus Limnocylindria bacterium]